MMNTTASRPNILMLVLDSARFDRLGIHGYHRRLTPALDAFAADAVDFTNANAPGGSTRPSMGSNFTGLYPQAYGFDEDKFPDEKHTMVAERLRDAGYRTYLFSSNAYVSPATGYTRGFETVLYLNRSNLTKVIRPTVLLRHAPALIKTALKRNTTYKVSSDLLLSEALRVLRGHGRDDPPFFLYIHMDVHNPYLSDRRYLRPCLEPGIDEETIRKVEDIQRNRPMMLDFARTDIPMETRRRYWSVLRSMYDASFKKCDDLFGELVAVLRRGGLLPDTMVVVTSDHGELIGERGGQMTHGLFPYEEVMRVPLVVKFPERFQRTGADPRLVSTIDLVPTYCELAGAPMPADQTQGISLLSDRRHDFVIHQRQNFLRISFEDFKKKFPTVDFDWLNLGHVIALKDERFKFVWTSAGRRFLFDLRADPGETADLADSRADLVDPYQSRFNEWRERIKVQAGSAEPEYEEAVMDHLRRLGYVE